MGVFAQEAVTLDEAVSVAMAYLREKIPAQSKVAVLTMTSPAPALSAYVIDSLSAYIVNGENLTLVERSNLEPVRKELEFQMSGEVSDETAISLGKKLGAQSIVSGSIEPMGTVYRLHVQAIEVETARILGAQNTLVRQDALLLALTEKKRVALQQDSGRETALNAAIALTAEYLQERIPPGAKVVVFNYTSDFPGLSNYVIDEVTGNIVNNGKLIVVDRRNTELLRQELDFQSSGEVSEETAQSIGKKLGAECVIFGAIQPLGDAFRLFTRAIDVETATVRGLWGCIVVQDEILAALTDGTKGGVNLSGKGASNGWEHKRLYLGLRPGVSLHFYNTDGTRFSGAKAETGVSLDAALQIAWQINPYFALQTELLFTADSMSAKKNGVRAVDEYGNLLYTYDTTYTCAAQSLALPVLAKLTFHPGIFTLGLYGGVYGSFPLGKTAISDSYLGAADTSGAKSVFGILGGGSAGVKIGPGHLFLDARYMADIGNTKTSGGEPLYNRGMLLFGLGYEIGFF